MTVRVTLAPSVSRETFELLAHSLGWTLYDVLEESDERPYEEIWAIDGGASAAHYIEDWFLSTAFVLMMGQHEARLASKLMAELPTINADKAARWAMSATNEADRARAAAYLADTAQRQADPDVLAAFARLLADAAPDVRRAAAFAASFVPWPELVDLVEPVATGDADGDVRGTATQALLTLREGLGTDLGAPKQDT